MKIPRGVKIVGIALAAIILLGLILPYFISVDSFRPKIVSMIEEKTGRKVTIGAIRARFIPHIGFTVSDVALGSPQEFGDIMLLKIDTLKGALAWGPLLHGDYQIDSLELDHPVVVLASDDRGHTNYEFGTGTTQAPGKKKEVDVARPLELSAVDLSGAELTIGHVTGPRHTLVPSMILTGVDVHLADVTTQPGALKLWSASIPLSGVKMALSGIKGPITFRSGELNLKDGHLNGTFDGAMGSALKASGTLQVASIENPVADVELNTPLLDLDQLASVAGGGTGGGSAEADASKSGSVAQAKGALVATIKAKADRVRYAPYEGTGAHADIKVFDNRVEAPLTMAFYGGSLGITARLETLQVPERFSANIQVTQVDMEKLLSVDPGTKGKMTGHGDLKLQVFGSLDKAPLNSLSGQGDFALKDGRLPGVSLGKQMQELQKVEKVLSLGTSGGGPSGETTFSLIGGDLAIRDARLHTNRTHIDSNMGTGDISGSIGFDQTLDLAGTWRLVPGGKAAAATAGAAAGTILSGGILAPVLMGAGASSLAVPFTVKGTVKNPELRPGGGFKGAGGAPSSSGKQQSPPQKKSILDLFKKP